MKTSRISFATGVLAMVIIALTPTLQAQSETAADAASATISSSEALRLKIPSPVEEVVQLSKSGIGDAVIISYIQSSERTYNVGAKDIINLRTEGVSPEVTTAMIQRGAEQRQAAVEAARQQKQTETENSTAPTEQAQPVPAPTVVVAPVPVTYYEPVQRVSTVSVHYFGSRPYNYRPYYYSSYRNYGPSYGYYYGPRVSVGYGYGVCRPVSYRASARFCR